MPKVLSRAGFTLIEILATVVITGVLGALAISKLSAMSKARKLEGETRLLFESIAKARSSALKKDVPYLMQFDVVNGTYATFADANLNGLPEASERVDLQRLDAQVGFGPAATGGPLHGPGGVGNPALKVEAGWNNLLVLSNDRAATVNAGALYLFGRGLKNRTACIRLPAGSRQIEMWRWDGSLWSQM